MRMIPPILLFLPVVTLCGCRPASEYAESDSATLTSSESRGVSLIPVEIRLPDIFAAFPVLEARNRSGQRILLQQSPAVLSDRGTQMGRSLVSLIPGEIAAPNWNVSEAADFEDRFSFDELPGDTLTILEKDRIVCSYRFGLQEPENIPSDRYRSSYIHPVVDPFGKTLTDDFPEDHLHHRGLSWMWPNVAIGDQRYDLWHIRGIYQRFERWLGRETGPVCATVGVKNTWRTAERTVADEWVWVRVFAEGELGRVIDISLTWQAREEIAIRGELNKGYGGLSFRFAPREETVITTASGRLPGDSDLQPFPWADLSGRFASNEELSGVAILQHPENPAFPAGWCLRHYGFLGVSWPGKESFLLKPGLPVTLRYRIWTHRKGGWDIGISEAYDRFCRPPRIFLSDALQN